MSASQGWAREREKKRPRLLFLSPLPPPVGGIAVWTNAVVRSPLAERFEIHVVDISPSDKGAVSQRSRFRIGRVADAARILRDLLRELVLFRPQIVHINTPYRWALVRDCIAIAAARAVGGRTILHFRGGDLPEMVGALPAPVRYVLLAVLRRVDRLLALTHETRLYLESVAGKESVRYLPNFIAIDEIDPPDRTSREAPVRVLFVGWIVEAKGVRELLAAAREVRGASFTLVGPQDPEFVTTLTGSLDALGPRVELLPPHSRDEIMKLYREADVFVLPTWREGFPNVVLEAMAWGLPVVATAVGAIPDVVRDGIDGMVVPPQDAQRLAAAIQRLVDDPELRSAAGHRARRRVEQLFSSDAVLGQLEAVYEELLAR